MTNPPSQEWIERARAWLIGQTHRPIVGHEAIETIRLARELQSSFDQGVERERERCARIADAYAEVNIEMAGDTLLADPILMRNAYDMAAEKRSHDLQIDGCIASSMFHAAQNLAAAIRLGERG